MPSPNSFPSPIPKGARYSPSTSWTTRKGRGRFKEVYIRRGTSGEIYGVEVSIYQYLCYTTEKPEKNAVQIYVGHHGNYQQGLQAFVSDMKASGLQLGTFVSNINQIGRPLTI
jgi:hypothetical protein